MKKNLLFTSTKREIFSSSRRFISLLIMSLLGVGTFVGLKATSPDMITSLDKFFDQHQAYDFHLQATHGFSDDTILQLKALPEIDSVEGSKYYDGLSLINEKQFVIRTISLPEKINTLDVIDGRLPENDNEIVIEKRYLTDNSLLLGDTIAIDNEQSILKNNNYTIVGEVMSPLYIGTALGTGSRGNTNVGAGIVNYYSFVAKSNFNYSFYTDLYLTVDGASQKITSKSAYLDLIAKAKISLSQFLNQSTENPSLDANETTTTNTNNFSNNVIKVYDREDDATYSDYIGSSRSIDNLSKVFPTVFYIVAILISLISMARMVEDNRLEIGTLKSLGFSNPHIMGKYVIYSGLATLLGGLIGSTLGFYIIPLLIWNIYTIIFSIPQFVFTYQMTYVIVGIAIALACIVGSSIYSVNRTIRESPSQLMRPKAPKPGKRIFLEKIPFIWRHLKFSNKITMRNIGRYKKRVIATIIGIMGCTALMLSGFGLRDAIIDIARTNYGQIFTYDQVVLVQSGISDEELNQTFSDSAITDFLAVDMLPATVNDYEVNIFVPSTDLTSMVNLRNVDTKSPVFLQDNEVVLTDKLAALAKISIGDEISIIDVNNVAHSLKVSAIVENYVGHLIYMNKTTFENNFTTFSANTIYVKTIPLSSEAQSALALSLLAHSKVMTVTSISSLIKSVENTLKSLNNVVIILLILSAMLSFVVMFNLTNINISERKRELATLKVLGFNNREVDNYINKELIILTLVGIILGLVMGYFLTNLIVNTVEIERIRFIHHIKYLSFIYSGLMSIIFAIIVIFIAHHILKKINMIASLKSVE
ncbi:MAG: FtsX-like permease family protein [Bacilli bacterium]